MRNAFRIPAVAGVVALALCLAPCVLAAGKTHDVTAQVVSVDPKAKTITIKTDDGKTSTAPVDEAAAADLGKLEAGDRVVLTCLDNEKGEHQKVTKIAMAPSKKE